MNKITALCLIFLAAPAAAYSEEEVDALCLKIGESALMVLFEAAHAKTCAPTFFEKKRATISAKKDISPTFVNFVTRESKKVCTVPTGAITSPATIAALEEAAIKVATACAKDAQVLASVVQSEVIVKKIERVKSR